MLDLLKQLFQTDLGDKDVWQMDRCFACRGPVRDGFIFPEDGVGFCKWCFHSIPCSCCQLPCGPQHRRLSDDRIICQHCYNTALITPRQLSPMYQTTLKFFRRNLKMKLKDHPRMKVVDSRYLAKLRCPPNTWGLYTNIEGVEAIYILNGIAEEQSLITLAHELTHYWQKHNCSSNQSLELTEGFAIWVAYRLAESKNLKRAMLTMRRNIAEPYFSGLRKMWRLENQKGVKGAIKYARTKTRL